MPVSNCTTGSVFAPDAADSASPLGRETVTNSFWTSTIRSSVNGTIPIPTAVGRLHLDKALGCQHALAGLGRNDKEMIPGVGIGKLQNMRRTRCRRRQGGLPLGALAGEGDGFRRRGRTRRQIHVQRRLVLLNRRQERRLKHQLQHSRRRFGRSELSR